MYQYDQYDQKIVDERVAQFRSQVERRMSGELHESEFRVLRLQNGLYMQLHAYMLRVAIPYGMMTSRQVRMLAHIARKYDRGYGHFSTRQNIQYNWPKLEQVPDILADLASVQMHAIQTSGNCIRNTTSDPYAGVSPDELEDPRPYCEIIRQWSTFHPEFAYLPRKFKIAVTGTPAHDRAAIRFHDIGIRLAQNDADEVGFEVWVGGGLGRTPKIAKVCRSFLPKKDLLTYLEAILRVYNRFGRRDNKYKARIKILVDSLGIEKFSELVEAEWEHIKDTGLELTEAELDRVRACFTAPTYESLPDATQLLQGLALGSNRKLGRWVTNNVKPHKVAGYSIVVLSLKAPGVPPGDVSDTQLDAIADLADRFSYGEVCATHDQNVVFQNVKSSDLPELFEALDALDVANPNVGTVTDSICCPGLDYCDLANARSIPISMAIQDRVEQLDYFEDLGPISLKMSGCINACGHHHVGNIGILGIDKKGVEHYQLMIGGSPSDDASIGKIVGPAFTQEQIVGAVETVLKTYLDQRESPEESFIEFSRRQGLGPFKAALYPDKNDPTKRRTQAAE